MLAQISNVRIFISSGGYFSGILPVVREAAESIGIKILYIFALPYDELISRYEKYGFSKLDAQLIIDGESFLCYNLIKIGYVHQALL